MNITWKTFILVTCLQSGVGYLILPFSATKLGLAITVITVSFSGLIVLYLTTLLAKLYHGEDCDSYPQLVS